MQERGSQSSGGRRHFLTRLGVGVSVLGTAATVKGYGAAPQSSDASRWSATRHSQDDWFEEVPGRHRLVFDTTNADGLSSALLYASNYFLANRTGYNLEDKDLAVIIVVRHTSTPFAYNDAIWSKYGTPISTQTNFVDPKTKQPPTVNVYNAAGRGSTVDALLKRGVHLAVCQMATRAVAGTIARAVGADNDEIYNEIAANLLNNSHLVPAGIVAVSRAQERGYTFVNAV